MSVDVEVVYGRIVVVPVDGLCRDLDSTCDKGDDGGTNQGDSLVEWIDGVDNRDLKYESNFDQNEAETVEEQARKAARLNTRRVIDFDVELVQKTGKDDASFELTVQKGRDEFDDDCRHVDKKESGITSSSSRSKECKDEKDT